MKIRIKANSIRLRLTKSKVRTFCKTGSFSEETEFNFGIFSYVLKANEAISSL